MAKKAKEAARKNEMGTLYQITKRSVERATRKVQMSHQKMETANSKRRSQRKMARTLKRNITHTLCYSSQWIIRGRSASQRWLGKYQPRPSKQKSEEESETNAEWQSSRYWWNNSRDVENSYRTISNWATQSIVENLGKWNHTIGLEEELNLSYS